MSIRLLALAAVLYFIPLNAFAGTMTLNGVEQSTTQEEAVDDSPFDEPESVQRKQSLAVHLGLTPADVIFGVPRNFRSESMNTFTLEPLYEAEEN